MKHFFLTFLFIPSLLFGQSLTVNDVIELNAIKTKVMPPVFDYMASKGFETAKGYKENGVFYTYIFHFDGTLHKADSIRKTMVNAVRLYSDEKDFLISAYLTDKAEVKEQWIKDLLKLNYRPHACYEESASKNCTEQFEAKGKLAVITTEPTRWGNRYELAILDN